MADVSVRPAIPTDAAEIGRLQHETWQFAYRSVLPAEVLQALDEQHFAAGWQAAITAAPSPAHRVLVALEGPATVGFAAFGPDEDRQPDDPPAATTRAIATMLVEPRWGRRGHGSRLLAAVADLAAADGAHRLVAWVPAADTASLQFYRSAGWEADGRQRSLDTGAGLVPELRLHTSLAGD
ncbi:MAG TPA: GNAT family N-acetyltransferase [Jatrophihabitans sp.]|nr:GNAT family N-acetyltransferase [Jatrophihabitans sp.]